MARIALGALTTLNLSTQVDPQLVDLFGVADYFSTPGYVGATPKLLIDGSFNLLQTASGAGIGYGAGSGGTVTQATSKSTAVTLNKTTGQIVMNAASLASGAQVLFQLNNSTLTTTDLLLVMLQTFASSAGNYEARVSNTAAGSAQIALKNVSGGALAEAVTLNFAVIKGSTT